MAEISTIQILTDFPNYFNNFVKNYQGLIAQSNYIYTKHPEMKPEYDALLNKSTKVYNQLYTVKTFLDSMKAKGQSVVNWAKETFGLSGLGVLPLVVAGIPIATLIVTVGYLLKELGAFASKIETRKYLESKGVSPVEASKQADAQAESSGGFFGKIQNILIIGGIIIALPYLLKMFGRR